MRLDARFRGHDGGQTTYFFYELPGQEPGKDPVDSRIPEVVIGIDVVQASRKYCKEEL